jgi:hypothetical protein
MPLGPAPRTSGSIMRCANTAMPTARLSIPRLRRYAITRAVHNEPQHRPPCVDQFDVTNAFRYADVGPGRGSDVQACATVQCRTRTRPGTKNCTRYARSLVGPGRAIPKSAKSMGVIASGGHGQRLGLDAAPAELRLRTRTALFAMGQTAPSSSYRRRLPGDLKGGGHPTVCRRSWGTG